jgi:hypothetical protein
MRFGLVKSANWASEMRKLDSKKSVNWDVQKRELILKSVNDTGGTVSDQLRLKNVTN